MDGLAMEAQTMDVLAPPLPMAPPLSTMGTPKLGANIDDAFIKMTYDQAMSALHSKAPNMTSGKNEQKHLTWKVATWSRKIREEQLGPTQGAQHRPVIPLPPAPLVHDTTQAPVPPPAQFVPPIPANNMQLPGLPEINPDDMRV